MAAWTVSQWIIVPLIVLGDLIVSVSILGLIVGAIFSIVRGRAVSVAEAKSNTPKLPA